MGRGGGGGGGDSVRDKVVPGEREKGWGERGRTGERERKEGGQGRGS